LCGDVVLSPTGRHLVYSCSGGRMIVQRLADGAYVYENDLEGFAAPLGFSRDGLTVLFRTSDGVQAVDVDGDARIVVDAADAQSFVAYEP
jgi:hypothetical protein